LAAKADTRLAQRSDRALEVVDLQHEAVPSAGLGTATVRHRLASAAGRARCAQRQAELAPRGSRRPVRPGSVPSRRSPGRPCSYASKLAKVATRLYLPFPN